MYVLSAGIRMYMQKVWLSRSVGVAEQKWRAETMSTFIIGFAVLIPLVILAILEGE